MVYRANDGTNLDELLGRTRIRPAKADSRREKWLRWLERVDKDVTNLIHHQSIWRELVRIWRDNPELPGSHIFDYFAYTYVHTQSVGVRRQAEVRDDRATIASLLTEIRDNPASLSRQFYVGMYPWGMQNAGDGEFTADFDPDGTGAVDPVVVEQDLATLQQAAAGIRDWVNVEVTHLEPKTPTAIPTFQDLDDALDVLGDLYMKWSRALTGTGLAAVAPVPQYDWLAPLRVPWIRADSSAGA